MAVVCSRCGAKQGMLAALSVDLATDTFTCPSCVEAIAREGRERIAKLKELAKGIILTTTHSIDGRHITSYLGIESVEFVIGTGVFSELTTEWQDFFGQRSEAFESKLQVAKRTAFEALAMIAADKGAHAVVGIDVDYTEFTGNRVGLIVNGTLVQLSAG